MLNICICDDQPGDAAAVRALAEGFSKAHPEHPARLTAFFSPLALLDHLEKSPGFDLYLLDMLMPHMTGLELAAHIRARGERAELLFLTTSREYAVEAFGVRAAGYLMKPVTQTAFDQAALAALRALAPEAHPALLLKTRDGVRKVPLEALVVIESFNHYRRCTLADGTAVETADTLTALWERLGNDPRYFSPHRAYIVNLDHVVGITANEVLLTAGLRIPVAHKRLSALRDAFLNQI